MGYAVYDTDKEAKRLIATDPAIKEDLIRLLGDKTYSPDGTYQTAYVASRVFQDKRLLEGLNRIVHPAVRRDAELWAAQQTLRTHRPVFLESAILFESGFDTLCERIVLITAPEDIRLSRVVNRDQTQIDKVRARIHAQMNDTELSRRADLTIVNDGSQTIEQLCQYITQHL